MKSLLTIAFCVFGSFAIQAQTVIISQYIETSSGTTPKSIELWNPSDVDIDLSSTPIVVEKSTNGAAFSTDATINTGTLAAGEVIILGNTDTAGSSCYNYVSEGFTYNGNDALRVKLNGTITDQLGEEYVTNPSGSAWTANGVSTKNQNIKLKSGITTGDVDGWTDPSVRFELVDDNNFLIDFGLPPGGCPVAVVTPTLTPNPTYISGLNYSTNAGGPSSEQTITFTGVSMGSENATVTAPTNFEVSLTAGSGYGSSVSLVPSSGAISDDVYVRLKSGLVSNDYAGNITIAHDSVTSINLAVTGGVSSGNDTIKVASYNLLRYMNSFTTVRYPSYRTVISEINPDLITFCEITNNEDGFNDLRDSVMAVCSPHMKPADFIVGNDMESAAFYDTTKFVFISNTPITTALRDINEFTFLHAFTRDTFRIYALHLKASSGTANATLRAAEVHNMRVVTDKLPDGSFFVTQGDFNIYNSNEAGYDSLTTSNTGADGHFIDPVSMPVASPWSNSSNAQYHTQSTRTRSFYAGATSGLDDRFDFILHSTGLSNSSDVYYLNNSFTPFGNDGNLYDDSINDPSNSAVSGAIADALHDASDHLPVFSQFVFEDGGTPLPIELFSFEGKRNKYDHVDLTWITTSEYHNKGFEIQRLDNISGWKTLGFQDGNGTSSNINRYEFTDVESNPNEIRYYRLKQFDFNGRYTYSNVIAINLNFDFVEFSVSPNPFQDYIKVNFNQAIRGAVEFTIYDISGRKIMSKTMYSPEASEVIETASMGQGLYFLEVTSRYHKEVLRIVKR